MLIEQIPGFTWMPVRTKPRREKKVSEFCQANNILCYLPLNRRVHRYERRSVEFHVPMFSSYIFCNLNEEKYQRLLCSNAILFKIDIDINAEENLIRELKTIQSLEKLSRETEISVKPELAGGVKVTVNNGPMRGMQGIIKKRKGKTLIFVNIDILGQSVSAEFDAGDLEAEEN